MVLANNEEWFVSAVEKLSGMPKNEIIKEIPQMVPKLFMSIWNSLSLDYAAHAGKYYIVGAERSSGYVFARWTHNQTIDTSFSFMKDLGNMLGFPMEILTDGGPGFRD